MSNIWGHHETLTAHLDQIATEFEQAGRSDIALAIDRISDRLENRTAEKYGKNTRQIFEDDVLDWAQEVAKENDRFMKIPETESRTREIIRPCRYLANSWEILQRSISQEMEDIVKSMLDLAFKKTKHIDPYIVDLIKSLKIDWKFKGSVS